MLSFIKYLQNCTTQNHNRTFGPAKNRTSHNIINELSIATSSSSMVNYPSAKPPFRKLSCLLLGDYTYTYSPFSNVPHPTLYLCFIIYCVLRNVLFVFFFDHSINYLLKICKKILFCIILNYWFHSNNTKKYNWNHNN